MPIYIFYKSTIQIIDSLYLIFLVHASYVVYITSQDYYMLHLRILFLYKNYIHTF